MKHCLKGIVVDGFKRFGDYVNIYASILIKGSLVIFSFKLVLAFGQACIFLLTWFSSAKRKCS